MTDDPIVAEVRRHRDEIAQECGNDLRRIFEYFRNRQHEGGRKVVNLSSKRERVKRERSPSPTL